MLRPHLFHMEEIRLMHGILKNNFGPWRIVGLFCQGISL